MNHQQVRARRTIRAKGYDYSQPGEYVVTLCAQDRLPVFGRIDADGMCLSAAGTMVEREWLDLPSRFPHVELDAHVIMPNHMHGIIAITAAILPAEQPLIDLPSGTAAGSLGRIMQAFKSLTTRQYIAGVREKAWPPFPGRLWQRNYYEHIVRNERALERIRNYIEGNPWAWDADTLNPSAGDDTADRRLLRDGL